MRITSRCQVNTFQNERADGTERVTVAYAHGDQVVRFEFEESHERQCVDLDRAEVTGLQTVIGKLLAGAERGSTLGDGDETLAVTYTNWGEPYDTGASFTLNAGDDRLNVELTARVLEDLHDLLGEIAPTMAASPSQPSQGF